MKRRVVFIALVVLAVWPAVQHVVTDSYQMNHWRFAGWAMYTKPSPMPVLGIYSPDEQFELPLLSLSRMRGGREALRDFADRRKLWGELHHPDDLAAVVLRNSPGLDEVRIYVNTVTFAPGGNAVWSTSLYECESPGRCLPVYEGRAHGR